MAALARTTISFRLSARAAARVVLAALVVALLVARLTLAAPPVPAPVNHATLDEPAATSAFLAAYARGDEKGAEDLASPLYRAEWKRRHVSAERRVSLLARDGQAFGTAWIQFAFVGGVAGADGFQHLLFVGRVRRDESDMGPEVWRVDTDAEGRVIWLELAWLMSRAATDVRVTHDPAVLASVAFPSGVGSTHPAFIVGVRALATLRPNEGYYAEALAAKSATEATGKSASALVFFAIDTDGGYRPGVWTFGEASPGLSTYGQVPERPAFDLAPSDRPMLLAYLASL